MGWFSRKSAEAEIIPIEAKAELTDVASESWETLTAPFGITANGVAVNAESAMRVPAVNCAVRTIAETVATLPAKVFKSDGEGKEPDEDHDAYVLVHDDANDWMSAGKVREIASAKVV